MSLSPRAIRRNQKRRQGTSLGTAAGPEREESGAEGGTGFRGTWRRKAQALVIDRIFR